MGWWDRLTFWLFRRYELSPIDLLARLLVAALVVYALWWALKTQIQMFP